MSLTINSKSYALDSNSAGTADYAGPANTMSLKDILRLARTAPKPTAIFSGVSRTMSRFSKTYTLTGALTPTAVGAVEINSSLPVGAADADIDTLCADLGSYVTSAAFKSLLKKQTILF